MPEKHHYIPVFYLKRWAGADGRLCVYSRPHSDISAKRKHPNAAAFEYDLYTIQGVKSETASHLERRFFLQADNDAAQALAHIEANPQISLDNRLRSAWSRFIMTLVHRNPQAVANLSDRVAAEADAAIREFRDNYQQHKRPGDPDTFAKFQEHMSPNVVGRAAAILMQKVMDSELVGNHLNGMKWKILTLSSAYRLLTSDRPIVMTNGLNKPNSRLAISISPKSLFIAASDPSLVDWLGNEDPDNVVKTMNDHVAKQAWDFVFGVDDRQLQFVANRLGTRLRSSPTDRRQAAMRRIICFVIYVAMMIGGSVLIYFQLFLATIVYFKIVAGAGMLVFLGSYLFWEDFLKPPARS